MKEYKANFVLIAGKDYNWEKRMRTMRKHEFGNTKFLADVENFAMIEFMYPSINEAKHTPIDINTCDIIDFSIN